MTLLTLALSVALAGTPGFYHPADIGEISEAYGRAAAEAGSRYDEASARAEAMATALQDYRLALDLLGERAAEGERERLEDMERQFHRDRAVLNAFLEAMMEDFDHEFSIAMERALRGRQDEVAVCRREIPAGRPLPGIPARMQANPDCEGEDLNEQLAGLMDRDRGLARAIDEILGLQWPEIQLERVPVPATDRAERHVPVAELFKRGAPRSLQAIDRREEEEREPMLVALEQGASLEERRALAAEARQIEARTAERRARHAQPVLEAAERWRDRRARREGTFGWCAQPPLLGGCVGDDIGDEVLPELLEDRRVRRALD